MGKGRAARWGWGVLAACLAASGVDAGGANPEKPGLPGQWYNTTWRTTGDRGYRESPALGRAVTGNGISAMCVECHYASPSRTTAAPLSLPTGDTEPQYRGSHFVWNQWDGTDRLTNPLRKAPWEKLTAWSTTGAFSKYGVPASNTSLVQAQGELLCESCHNAVRNAGRGLLVEVYSPGTGLATLCTGCHADVTGTSHHPLGAVDATDRAGVRNPPTDPALTGGIRYFAAPNVVTCTSCHTPHDAQTATGARVLRRGASRVTGIPGVFARPVNVAYYANVPSPGVTPGQVVQRSTNGLHRQGDLPAGTFLVTNGDPVCDACHKHND